MPTDNSLLFARQKSSPTSTKGYIGDLRYAPEGNHNGYIRNGFNASSPIAQVSTITLSGASVATAEGLVIEVVRGNGSPSVVITALNDIFPTAPTPGNALLVNAINGVSVNLTAPSIPGYVAVATSATTVTLTGPIGESFSLVISPIGAYTATSVITVATSIGSYIPYGRAIVNNALANSLVYPNRSIIADNNDSIVKLADNATDTFVGITIRSVSGEIGFSQYDLIDGYAPNECVHWVPNSTVNGTSNQVMVRLEATATAPVVDQPVYYRFAAATADNPLGGFSNVTSANHALARDIGSNNFWVVKAAVDTSRRLYYVGLKY